MTLTPPNTPGHHARRAPGRETVSKRELDARSAYSAAVAAATRSLERAQQLFEAASAAIDTHISRSLAAEVALHLVPARTNA